MRVVNGKRMWLLAYAGVDEADKPWPDTWEPSRNLTPDLVQAWFQDVAQRGLRIIEVDGRPLDTLVQRSIAQAVMRELGASFGRVHCIPVDALSLSDLASAYLKSLSARFGVALHENFDKPVTTVGLQLTDPSQVGEFLAFERFMPANTGTGALRYKLGRKSNTDAVVVMPLAFFYSDNKHTPGTVNFHVEISTCKINGETGELTPPHLGENSKNKLKTEEYKNRVIVYAREKFPRVHDLVAKDEWHLLPAHIHAVR